MKIVKLKSMGGSGKTATQHVVDGELAKNIATVKRGVEAKVAEIKRDLAQWIAATTASTNILNDFGTPASIALLETALDRYLDIYDEEEAREFIEKAFLRAVQRHRGPLQ